MNNFPLHIKALLIDFDGTLVDSLPSLWRCYKKFLENYQKNPSQAEFNSLLGPPLPEIVKELIKVHSLSETFERLYNDYWTLACEAYAKDVTLFPEALNTLRALKEKGMKLAIVTSAPRQLVLNFLTNAHLENFFDELISSLPNESCKPAPDVYIRALNRLGILPHEALAIEDSVNGIQSAHQAGIFTVHFGRESNEIKNLQCCDVWVKDWTQAYEVTLGYQTFELGANFQGAYLNPREEIKLSDLQENTLESIWQKLQARHQDKLFNGKLFNFHAFTQNKIWGNWVDYQIYLVKKEAPLLYDNVPIYPLAISCISTYKNFVLVGRRSHLVSEYPGFLELAPSGGVDEEALEGDQVNLYRQAFKELREESGIEEESVEHIEALALVRAFSSNTLEIILRLHLKIMAKSLSNPQEYSELKWIAIDDLKKLANDRREDFVPLSLFLIRKIV